VFILRRIVYFLRKAVGSIRENPFINLITVGTIAIAMLLEGSFLLVFSNLSAVVDRLTRDVEISAYLRDDASQAAVASLSERLNRLPEVEEVKYLSKEDALELFRKQNPEDRNLLEELGENPLPASFQLKLASGYRDAENVTRVAADLASEPSIEEVEYGQEWIAKFTAFLKLLQIAGIGLGAMLVLAVVFVVSNTIKLAVFARRDELEIMQLVGATPMFIRIPYLLEGVLQGGAGSLLALAGLWFGWRTASVHASESLAPVFGTSRLEFLPLEAVVGLIAGGVFLGFFGSLFAMGRFLRSPK
jgi:cell division transport system permease protein